MHFSCVSSQSWVFLTGMPVYLVRLTSLMRFLDNERCTRIGEHRPRTPSRLTLLGLCLYAGSLLLGITADRQKAAWRRVQENKDHEEKFITSSHWSLSRHRKYDFHISME
jgi:steroid 5-alpha reductase family enzyme